MTDCMAVTLNTIGFDGSADSDGIIWGWRELPGWWEGAAPQTDQYGLTAADGSAFGQGWERGRPVSIVGSAVAAQSDPDPVSTLRLARRKLVGAYHLNSDVDMTVDEGGSVGVLRLPVRKSLAPRFNPQRSTRELTFEIPLMSSDWAKTSITLTQTVVGSGGAVTNDGDAPAQPSLRISGDSAANVGVINATTGEAITTTLDLGALDVLVIDCATGLSTLNGVDASDDVDLASVFFDLDPGASTINLTNGGTASLRVDFRDSWK